ncbi:MAG: hypothetical protein OXH90_03545 [Paracoccaceae bacterium]|nr:hypothetical protein [Paracoccaceae bacterium]MDE2916904.1 hypothetical protein [Paracoccaceae bacterium]
MGWFQGGWLAIPPGKIQSACNQKNLDRGDFAMLALEDIMDFHQLKQQGMSVGVNFILR